MTTLRIDLDLLYRIMAPSSPADQMPLFWRESILSYFFYGYKGPITLISRVSKKDLLDRFYQNRNTLERTPENDQLAFDTFKDIYLNRAIKVLGKE